MNSILSIDFDYFINVSAKDREYLFPSDISETMSSKEIDKLWEECYKEHPEIYDIGLVDNFRFMWDYLHYLVSECGSSLLCLNTDSHAYAYDFVKGFISRGDVHITNIDFHHDYYFMYGGRVTRANWLMKACSDFNIKDVLWIAREDSEVTSLGGDFPYPYTTDISKIKNRYDGVFICFSPEWTPPHLRKYYDYMAGIL